MRKLSLLTVVLIAIAVAGCGERVLDTPKAEKFVQTTVQDEIQAQVKSVDCPEGVKEKKGSKFTCLVVGADGSRGRALMTQTDAKGGVHMSAPFIHVHEVEASIVSGLEKQLDTTGVKVDCPEIIPVGTGRKFKCAATDKDGQKAGVDVIQKDAEGHVQFRLVPAS